MKAVILNSGIGSRMGALTEDKPKCLVSLKGEETILSRQIRMLQAAGIKDILITIGPYGDMIPEYVAGQFHGLPVTYVRNGIYDKTNYIYSMYLADEYLREEVLLLHGDIVLEEKVLEMVLREDGKNLAIIDSTVPLPEKDFKARITGSEIREIGTTLPREDGIVFLLPVYRLSQDFMRRWMDEIAQFVKRGETGVYAENAFNAISEGMGLKGLDIKGAFCMEIDTVEDLHTARERIQ
jgi:choline kinase